MEIVTEILTIFGGVLVASVTYYLTKLNDRVAEWRKEKLRFYIEFVESLSGITDYEQSSENDIRFAKACNDLYLFAPSDVLCALRDFQDEIRISNTKKSPENYHLTLSKLLLQIRKDIKVRDKKADDFTVKLWTSGNKEAQLKTNI